MSILSLVRKQRADSVSRHILKTHFNTLAGYDVDLKLIHNMRPVNAAILFTFDSMNSGFVVPAKTTFSPGVKPGQFVFPFIITDLGEGRIALQEANSGLFLCAMPPEYEYMVIDKVAVHNWETFTCITLDDDATERHPAQAFLLHQPLTA